jgi:uncharacterized coiled-coil DUF342 family protein
MTKIHTNYAKVLDNERQINRRLGRERHVVFEEINNLRAEKERLGTDCNRLWVENKALVEENGRVKRDNDELRRECEDLRLGVNTNVKVENGETKVWVRLKCENDELREEGGVAGARLPEIVELVSEAIGSRLLKGEFLSSATT